MNREKSAGVVVPGVKLCYNQLDVWEGLNRFFSVSENYWTRVVRESRTLRGNAKISIYRNPPVKAGEPGAPKDSLFADSR